MIRSKIVSTGSYVPEKVVTNYDLEKMMDTTHDWIVQRSGMEERRLIGPKDTSVGMAKAASLDALKKANLVADDIDAIIYACILSDYVFPGSGVLLQKELGCKSYIPALDIRNQCTAFLYALSVADAWIRSGMYKRILVVGSEIHSTSMDYTTRGRDISVLFGDGAAAMILEASKVELPQFNSSTGSYDIKAAKSSHVIDTILFSQGEHAEKLALTWPTPNEQPKYKEGQILDERIYPYMDGRFVFKHACTRMPEVILQLLNKHNLKVEDVDFVVAHQANLRINQMVMNQLGIPENKTHNTMIHYGNTTAATIPLTFNEAHLLGKVKRGDLVVFVAFGSGFTWGASLIRF